MNKSEFIVLSLTYITPSHSYILNKFMETFEIKRWVNVSKATLYNTVERLEKKWLLQVELKESTNAPSRKEYTITEIGKDHLRELLTQMLQSEFSNENYFQMGMMFAFNITTENLSKLLHERINYLSCEKQDLGWYIELAKKENQCVTRIMCHTIVKQIDVEIESISDWLELLKEKPNYFNQDLVTFYRGLIEGGQV